MEANFMKRKLIDKKAERATQVEAMETALASGDNAAFETAKNAVANLNTEIENIDAVLAEKSRFGEAPADVPFEAPKAEKKPGGIEVMAKMLRREKLTDQEAEQVQKALVTGDNAVSGENYLVPADVQTEIRDLRKSYVSAKPLVNVIPVADLTGSTNFENSAPSGLTAFDDGDTIATETDPTFVKKPWTIKFYGKLIPISRILLKVASGLMAYLNRWFVRNAVISENGAIFTALKTGYNSGTPKSVAGWEELKQSITVDLDPSCLIDGVIVTNQSGFACLDAEVDGEGRPVLQANPAKPTEKLFQGLPVVVFPNAQLANIDATHFPMIYGSTKAGADFMEYEGLLFETSEHFLFNKNQNCLRVIEGFDVVSTDTSAYIYGSFSATV
ncbi:MAG: phage major capsid protein [Clostridiales bacterium]|nr:phage major capsid protein [Clostridiales bacterium]